MPTPFCKGGKGGSLQRLPTRSFAGGGWQPLQTPILRRRGLATVANPLLCRRESAIVANLLLRRKALATVANALGGWLAGWTAGWPAGQATDQLAGLLVGRPPSQPAGQRAGWLDGQTAIWRTSQVDGLGGPSNQQASRLAGYRSRQDSADAAVSQTSSARVPAHVESTADAAVLQISVPGWADTAHKP